MRPESSEPRLSLPRNPSKNRDEPEKTAIGAALSAISRHFRLRCAGERERVSRPEKTRLRPRVTVSWRQG
jgi:hypothetical protein